MYCKVVFDVPLDRDFDYAVPEALRARVRPGVRVTAPFGRVLTTGLVVAVSEQTQLDHKVLIKEIACVLDEKPLFGSDLFPLAQFMKSTWGGPIGQILFALVPPQAYFKLQPPEDAFSLPAHKLNFPWNKDQLAVLNRLTDYLQKGFHRILLTGLETSSQTDMVIQLAQTVLQNYGQVLLTLPDVLAAQQFSVSLQEKLGKGNVFCWHSKMLISQKKKIFSIISNGQPCVIVSARSGGLLPFKNLRLAAILEEENDNYKQEENKPYFHLRNLLAFRCRQHQALLIHISDTPSLELIKAVQDGEVQEIILPHLAKKLVVKIVSKKGAKSKLFSDELVAALEQNLNAQKASLLILNRRGYSNAYYCLNCGTYAKCKKCGTILAREKNEKGEDYLICHKCGQREPLEQTCPLCQNKIFKSRGGGTQKIANELSKLFPSARVLRLDSDTLKNKEGQGHLVNPALDKGQADIIVGTRQALQAAMSNRVTLAALMDADLELDGPDFRSSEKLGQLLFKLMHKLASRPQGSLFIQASSQDIYPFETLQSSYEVCAQEELEARRSFQYPPFVKMVKVLIKAKDQTLLEAETARIMSAAAPYCKEVLGPVKTGKKTDKLLKQYILCKTQTEKYLALVAAIDGLQPSKKTEIKLIADPYDFY